jgi:hypothetical protein
MRSVLTPVNFQERADTTTKWVEATQKLKSLIEKMSNLKELTYVRKRI